MGYKINKIIIQNFKVFNKDTEKNSFYNKEVSQNLQILTGQNGYGKSSIYDAIELVLTGRIERLQSVSGKTKNFKDNLIANNTENDSIIALELYNKQENKYFSIMKRIPKSKIKGDKEVNIHKWFETYISTEKFSYENLINTENKKSNEELNKILKTILKIEPEYFYINYIQQQDPIHFLKKKEEERKSVIDELLQIDDLKNQNYRDIIEKIELYNQSYLNLKNDIIAKINKLSDEVKVEVSSKPKYIKLFNYLDNIEWDLCKEKINNKGYEEDLQDIELLVENYDTYKKLEDRSTLIKYKNNISIINKIAYYLKYNLSLDNLRKERQDYLTILEIKDLINKNKFEELNKENYAKYIDLKNFEEIENEKKNIEQLKKNNNKVLMYIDNKRLNFIETFKENENLKSIGLSENKCPLCGNFYGNKEELIKSIDSYTSIIQDLLGVIDLEIKEKENNLNIKIKKIEKDLDILLKNIQFAEAKDTNLYNLVIDKLSDLTTLNNELNRLDELGVNIINKFKDHKINELEINELKNNIETYIQEKIDEIKVIDKNEINLNKPKLDRVFNVFFNKNEENVKLIDKENIHTKLKYLDYCYKMYIFENNNKNIEEIKELKNKIIKVKYILNKLEKIKSEYDTCLQEYKLNIISKIEIPLYIYTGKILQNLPTGLGVFCNLGSDTSDKITRLKFIGNMKTSHDIVNTFSSGQLAGFIISFTLAMKKVYNNNLDVILIDDPVQTMDEINLISFTEILRNEFSDKQVIMSTHEQNIAGYIDYKYKKYNLDSSIMDVRKSFI